MWSALKFSIAILSVAQCLFEIEATGSCLTCSNLEASPLEALLDSVPKADVLDVQCIRCELVALTEDKIPADIANFTGLTELSLAQNNIVSLGLDVLQKLGPIAPTLKILDLSKNEFESTVPVQLIAGLLTLSDLDLSEAGKLSGPVPDNINDLVTLTSLKFGTNQFTGTLPEAIGDLTRLSTLELNDNRLTGTVPESIGRLVRLTRLRLQGNDFIGTMPNHVAEDTDVASGFVFSELPRDLNKILIFTGTGLLGVALLAVVYRYTKKRNVRPMMPVNPAGTGFSSWIGSSAGAQKPSPGFAQAELWETPPPGHHRTPFVSQMNMDQPEGPPPNYSPRHPPPGLSAFGSSHGSDYPPSPGSYGDPQSSGAPPGYPVPPPRNPNGNLFARMSNKFTQSTNWFSAKYPKNNYNGRF